MNSDSYAYCQGSNSTHIPKCQLACMNNKQRFLLCLGAQDMIDIFQGRGIDPHNSIMLWWLVLPQELDNI